MIPGTRSPPDQSAPAPPHRARTPRLRSTPVASLLAALLLLPTFCCRAGADECAGRSPHIVVVASERVLRLCRDGRVEARYGVRLARAGVGKRKEGDRRVPLGRYPLGPPRTSSKFGLFIPVEYPTSAQRKAGYTGGSVGIHGPHRAVAWLGKLVNAFDTTDGCIGLATDEEMAAVARFARRFHPAFVEVRADDAPGRGSAASSPKPHK